MCSCSLQGCYGLDCIEQSTFKAVLNHRYLVAVQLYTFHNLVLVAILGCGLDLLNTAFYINIVIVYGVLRQFHECKLPS